MFSKPKDDELRIAALSKINELSSEWGGNIVLPPHSLHAISKRNSVSNLKLLDPSSLIPFHEKMHNFFNSNSFFIIDNFKIKQIQMAGRTSPAYTGCFIWGLLKK